MNDIAKRIEQEIIERIHRLHQADPTRENTYPETPGQCLELIRLITNETNQAILNLRRSLKIHTLKISISYHELMSRSTINKLKDLGVYPDAD